MAYSTVLNDYNNIVSRVCLDNSFKVLTSEDSCFGCVSYTLLCKYCIQLYKPSTNGVQVMLVDVENRINTVISKHSFRRSLLTNICNANRTIL